MTSSLSLLQYFRFLLVGGAVALLTIACREVVALLLVADTPFHYSVSVAVAYLIGICISYWLNRQFTFRISGAGRDGRQFALFFAIAVLGMVSTWLFALGVRYAIDLDAVAGRYSASLAFAAAALLSSLITYPLNAAYIFPRRQQHAAPPR